MALIFAIDWDQLSRLDKKSSYDQTKECHLCNLHFLAIEDGRRVKGP